MNDYEADLGNELSQETKKEALEEDRSDEYREQREEDNERSRVAHEDDWKYSDR